MMPVRIRSARGVDKKTRGASAGAWPAPRAAPYPNDPAVQLALAEAEFDAGNYARRPPPPIARSPPNPQSVEGMIYKGRAEMELADAREGADWDAIRKWFLGANRVDPEAAEPLVLFYESYRCAGATADQRMRSKGCFTRRSWHRRTRLAADRGLRADPNQPARRSPQASCAPLANSPHGGRVARTGAQIPGGDGRRQGDAAIRGGRGSGRRARR